MKLFDFFTKKVVEDTDKEDTNVVPLTPPAPKEDPAKIFYRFGVTDNGRLAFQMGYSEITMNREGCQNLINQLTFFMNQLQEDEEE